MVRKEGCDESHELTEQTEENFEEIFSVKACFLAM